MMAIDITVRAYQPKSNSKACKTTLLWAMSLRINAMTNAMAPKMPDKRLQTKIFAKVERRSFLSIKVLHLAFPQQRA
jgi:hypothetical protein